MKDEFRPTVLRHEALDSLSGRWIDGVLIASILMFSFFVCCLLSGISLYLYYAVCLLGLSVLAVGSQWAFFALMRGEELKTGEIFAAFSDYGRVLAAYLLTTVVTLIGFMLLIVPGIVLSLGLSLTFYILRDDDEISVIEAVKRSWTMMHGHKWELFLLMLSFLGWAILATITIFGVLWFIPYVQTAMAHFYETTLNVSSWKQDEEL